MNDPFGDLRDSLNRRSTMPLNINVPVAPQQDPQRDAQRILRGLLEPMKMQRPVELMRDRPMPRNIEQFPPAPPFQPQQVEPAPLPQMQAPRKSVLVR